MKESEQLSSNENFLSLEATYNFFMINTTDITKDQGLRCSIEGSAENAQKANP